MDQLKLFEQNESEIFENLLEFHDTHNIANGEFYNLTADWDFPSYPVKTGYFAQTTDGVAISRIPPAWYHGPVVSALAPSEQLLKEHKAREVTSEEFCKRFYNEVLATLDPHAVYKRLESYGFPRLLCWEREGAFCHRHLVQEWMLLYLLRRGVIT